MRKSYLFGGLSVFVAVVACGDDGGGSHPTSDLSTLCARGCVRANAASCAGDNKATCESECVSSFSTVPSVCTSQLNAELQCASKATFTCDSTQQSAPVGCDAQLAALTSCITANSPTPGPTNIDAGVPTTVRDAAIPLRDAASLDHPDSAVPVFGADSGISSAGDGGAARCSAKDPSNTCQTCSATKCCAEVLDCDAECISVSNCASACDNDPNSTDACYDACADAGTVAGVDKFNALAYCLEDFCELQCF
ncbi:MAG: hypothetical protein JWN48_3906 [Myxococcaceae bacterium]|nr:hypothetical protein [Myxococcaceae bacterium]